MLLTTIRQKCGSKEGRGASKERGSHTRGDSEKHGGETVATRSAMLAKSGLTKRTVIARSVTQTAVLAGRVIPTRTTLLANPMVSAVLVRNTSSCGLKPLGTGPAGTWRLLGP